MSYTLSVDNQRVWEFYKKHNELDFGVMSSLFVDVMEQLMINTNTSINASIATQLLDTVKSLQTQVSHIHDDIIKIQPEINAAFSIRFSDFKHQYTDELKMIFSSSENKTMEKILHSLERQTETINDKTKILITEIIPKNNEVLSLNISAIMKELYTTILQDISALSKSSVTKSTLDTFIATIDERFLGTLTKSQSVFNDSLVNFENRFNTKILETSTDNERRIHEIRDLTDRKIAELKEYVKELQHTIQNDAKTSVTKEIMTEMISRIDTRVFSTFSELKEITTVNNTSQQQINGNVNELLKKMEGSSSKGKISENLLLHVINTLFPIAEIEYVGNTKESGDILMKRRDKPTILFENKDYTRNVGQEEIKKFYRDVEQQECSGIMLAQRYAIANKENFEIEITSSSNILVFMHNVEYNSDKIKTAVNIIDHFYEKLDDLSVAETENETENSVVTINKNILDEINKEIIEFANSKLLQIKTIRDYSSKLLSQIDSMKLPALDTLLAKYYSETISKKYTCHYCRFFIGKNERSVKAHMRSCEEYKKFKETSNNNT